MKDPAEQLVSALTRAHDLLIDVEIGEAGWFGDRAELLSEIDSLLPAPEPPPKLTFPGAVGLIRSHLAIVQSMPHAEHPGPDCPICGLTTRLLNALEDDSDGTTR